jgi:hypothetical protein
VLKHLAHGFGRVQVRQRLAMSVIVCAHITVEHLVDFVSIAHDPRQPRKVGRSNVVLGRWQGAGFHGDEFASRSCSDSAQDGAGLGGSVGAGTDDSGNDLSVVPDASDSAGEVADVERCLVE